MADRIKGAIIDIEDYKDNESAAGIRFIRWFHSLLTNGDYVIDRYK